MIYRDVNWPHYRGIITANVCKWQFPEKKLEVSSPVALQQHTHQDLARDLVTK